MAFSGVSENIYIFLITLGYTKIDKFLKTEYKVIYLKITKAATGGVLWKKVFLKILQISQENTCVGMSF